VRVTDWSTLEHAYGAADEVPDLLAAIAEGDDPGAVSELFTVLYHQGNTYSATEAAIPALVDLALTGPAQHRASIVRFLGALAREDQIPVVVEHSERLEVLLVDAAAAVREAAAYLLAEYAGPRLTETLVERYAVETDPVVRASLLMAIDDSELALDAFDETAPEVCIAAALVLAEADEELPDGAAEKVAAAYEHGDPLDGEWSWGGDTVGTLLERLDDPGFYAVLAGSRDAHVRMCVTYALADAIRDDPDERLITALAPLLTDPDRSVRLAAVHAAGYAGRAATIADGLAAAAEPLTHGDAPNLDDARKALEILIRLDDPRWRRLLLAAWQRGSTHDNTADVVFRAGASGDPELVAAAHARIAAIDAGHAKGRVRYNRAGDPETERAALERLLASW
jgi:HEAT repeat protein